MSCFLKLSKEMTNRYGSWLFCYVRASEIAFDCYYRQVIWHIVCYTYGRCLTDWNRHTVLPSVIESSTYVRANAHKAKNENYIQCETFYTKPCDYTRMSQANWDMELQNGISSLICNHAVFSTNAIFKVARFKNYIVSCCILYCKSIII